LKSNLAYDLEIISAAGTETANISASWTRGLAAHPLAAAVTLVALAFAFSTHIILTLIASLVSFLAALVTLVAFAIDIALFARVRNEMKGLGVDANTNTAPAFWMTLVAFVLLLLAGCTVCLGRRKTRMADATTSATPNTSHPREKAV
jgi:chromate transport protein ChrA